MLDPHNLEKLARALTNTRERELDCNECFEQVDRFVEMELVGKDAAEALPLVKDHLDKCGDCREEFEALMEALLAETASLSQTSSIRNLWVRLRRAFGSGS